MKSSCVTRDHNTRIVLIACITPFATVLVYLAVPVLGWLQRSLLSHAIQPISTSNDFVFFYLAGLIAGVLNILPAMATYRTDWRFTIPIVYGLSVVAAFVYMWWDRSSA